MEKERGRRERKREREGGRGKTERYRQTETDKQAEGNNVILNINQLYYYTIVVTNKTYEKKRSPL